MYCAESDSVFAVVMPSRFFVGDFVADSPSEPFSAGSQARCPRTLKLPRHLNSKPDVPQYTHSVVELIAREPLPVAVKKLYESRWAFVFADKRIVLKPGICFRKMRADKLNRAGVLVDESQHLQRVILTDSGERRHQPPGNSKVIGHVRSGSQQANHIADFTARKVVGAFVLN